MDSREIQPRGVRNGQRADSDQIKAEIDHTRERIDDTLDALAEKLHPRHFLDEVIDYVRSPRQMSNTAGRVGQVIWHKIQEHPMPSLLIGAGIAWMLSEQRRRAEDGPEVEWATEYEPVSEPSGPGVAQRMKEKTGALAHNLKEKTGDLAHSVREKSGAMAQSLREKSGAMVHSLKEKSGAMAHNVGDKAGSMAHSVREKSGALAHTMKEKTMEQATRLKEATSHLGTQTRERATVAMHRAEERFSAASQQYPLAVGLGFLAVGVIAGLALPHTYLEDRTLGERADHLKDRVKEQGKQVVESAQRAASAVVHTAQEEAERQGLTPQNLAEKLKHVASDAAKAAADSAAREGLDKQSLADQAKTVAREAKRAAKEEVDQVKGSMA